MRISDWSSDVCSSDLFGGDVAGWRFQHIPHAADHAAEESGSHQSDGQQRIHAAAGAVQPGRAADRHEQEPGDDDLADAVAARSEEHPSELQSLMRISYAVFCFTNTKR